MKKKIMYFFEDLYFGFLERWEFYSIILILIVWVGLIASVAGYCGDHPNDPACKCDNSVIYVPMPMPTK